jgi:8-oxo-dGTP pyrophosphatase MutT (NUDIX family)
VVLLRRGGRHADRGLEVLMLQRNPEARFMPGVWVFPGGALDTADGEGRDEVAHRACAVRELAEEAGIDLPAGEELVPFSRWITPEVISTRFDARFYLALAPPHSPPRPDGREVVDAGWFSPREALEANAGERMALAFPTVAQLESLLPFGSSEEAIAAFRGREVTAILPKVIADGDGHRVVLPGEDGYPAD